MPAIQLFKRFSLALIVGVSLSVTGFAVQAETRADTNILVETAAKSYAGKGSARFDWRKGQGAQPQVSLSVTKVKAPLGNGSWICSPAGFGSKSKCYKR
ncbi:hypothetical protein RYZ20_03755 [Thioclava sp. A2]|uniref:hypothetical protein n=1 Tax=Thioclava sp. FCG-A2 TaxID=3080562 RepID=UPI002953B7AA|nr:hypothetical protein [Thioclava sp. A2]MDV7270011.1 hypothetical protein [Thioclava sp. A2]